ncbi:HAMP domain-containing sensor histidine kinase [uncultured Roseivirga sp.]|uniref:sensor histidine kinase n=1 Tax=uncultured Roseivirga sp. TaxID=543088 RepID=UPI0030DBEEF5
MRIRSKITLIFTLTTCTLLLVTFVFIYYFAKVYSEKEFYEHLSKRAKIEADFLLKAEELDSLTFNQIQKEHLLHLTNEHTYVVPKSDQNTLPEPVKSFALTIEDNEGSTQKIDSIAYFGIIYPYHQNDYVVIISAIDEHGINLINSLKSILIIAFITCSIVIFIVGIYQAKQVLIPISGIVKRANEIKASNLHLRLDTGENNDELAELSSTFNNMLDRLETSFEIQSNFVSNASHELKNPLTAILGEVEVALRKQRTVDEYIASLNTIEKESNRLEILVKCLLELAQADHDNKGLIIESIRVDELMLIVKSDIDKIKPENQISFDFSELPETAECLIIQGSQSLLRMVLNNIVENACKFSMNKVVKIKMMANESWVEIEVNDKGIGIPPQELKNIFEHFYRASNARAFNGFGIGLPLAQKVIKIHGGSLIINSKEGVGTNVRIRLPNYRQAVSIDR